MKNLLCLAIGALAILFPLAAETTAVDQQWAETFVRANDAYEEKRFQDAIEGYKALIKAGYQSGHAYYNLGNAWFRLDQLGKAILNYERARLLMPRDADLNFNLRLAVDQTRDAVAESQGAIRMTFFWLDSLNLSELTRGFVLINALFWGTLIVRLFVRAEWMFYVFLVILIFWLVAGASFGLKWYQVGTDDRAVILREEVNILAGPDGGDTILFKLHAGTIVHEERSEEDWTLVRLSDKKRGWVESEAIEKIALSS